MTTGHTPALDALLGLKMLGGVMSMRRDAVAELRSAAVLGVRGRSSRAAACSSGGGTGGWRSLPLFYSEAKPRRGEASEAGGIPP